MANAMSSGFAWECSHGAVWPGPTARCCGGIGGGERIVLGATPPVRQPASSSTAVAVEEVGMSSAQRRIADVYRRVRERAAAVAERTRGQGTGPG